MSEELACLQAREIARQKATITRLTKDVQLAGLCSRNLNNDLFGAQKRILELEATVRRQSAVIDTLSPPKSTR